MERDAGALALLEREREMGEVERLLDEAAAGRGRLLLVEGPAGIGKTALLAAAQARARARGMLVLSARASEIDRDFPFGIVRQLLEPVAVGAGAARREAAFRGAAGAAGPLLGVGAPTATTPGPHRLLEHFHALYWLMANLADQAPTLATLDDVHWADPSSLQFLEFLLPRVEELRLLVLVAARPHEPGTDAALIDKLGADPAATAVQPTALSETAVATLVTAELSAAPPPAFARACHAATGGNPFLLKELLRQVVADGVAPSGENAALVAQVAPATVARAVLVRLARLGVDASALARAVAVLGDGTSVLRAAELAGLPEPRAAEVADQLGHAGILAPRRPLEFLHPMLRSAVYGDLGPAERDRAHRQAARRLAEDGAAADAVAVHLLATEPSGDATVVATLRAAARIALERGALTASVALLRRALDEPPPGADRGALLLQLGSAELQAGDPEAAASHLDEGGRLTADPRARAATVREHLLALAVCGRRNEAAELGERIVDELSDLDPDLATLIEGTVVAGSLFDSTRLGWARQRLEDRRGRIDAATPGGRVLLAVRTWLDAYYGDQPAALIGDAAERALGAGRLLADTGGVSPPFYFALIGVVLTDHVEAAHRELDRAVESARRRGSAPAFALASGWRSWVLARQGRLVDAEADARLCAQLALPQGWFVAGPAMLGFILDALIDRGEVDDAEQVLEQSGMAQQAAHENQTFDPVVHARARLRTLRGDLVGARADVAAALARGYRWNTLEARQPAMLVAPELVADLDEARSRADALMREALSWVTPRAIGIALRARALVADGVARLDLLHEAATVLSASPARLELARVLVDLGASLRSAGRRTDARSHLTEALDVAEDCGARPLAARARAELRAAGGRPRRARTTGVDALTASEQRIAAMAAAGMSNTEIAQALFVTRKTVESHLAGVFRKLDIRSRAQIEKAMGSASTTRR